MFNNSKAIKNTSPTYPKNLIHTWQIWIEYNHSAWDIDERRKKNEEYKVNSMDF